jgi:fatty-acyl-CoA synthase
MSTTTTTTDDSTATPQLKVGFSAEPTTVGAELLARRADTSVGLRFEDRSWTWPEVFDESARRANWLLERRQPGTFHVGVLLDNVPDFVFFFNAVGLAGAVIVPINPTRRGAELANDIVNTDIQLLITDATYLADVQALGLALAADRIVDVDSESFQAEVAAQSNEIEPTSTPADLFVLIFTSGTSGSPKAVRFTHGKVMFGGVGLRMQMGVGSDDVAYVAMPLFHSPCAASSRRRPSLRTSASSARRTSTTSAGR